MTTRTRPGLALAAVAAAAFLLAGPGAAHACGAHETSSDTMDQHEARSASPDAQVEGSEEMDAVGSGTPIDARAGVPDVVGASSSDTDEARSEDAGDLPYEAPQAGAPPELELPDVAPSLLASPAAADAFERLKAAKAQADQAAADYATMIRRGYPTGAEREAIVQRRDATRRAFDEALAGFEAAQAD